MENPIYADDIPSDELRNLPLVQDTVGLLLNSLSEIINCY